MVGHPDPLVTQELEPCLFNRFCVGGVLRASFQNGFAGEIKEIIISSPNSDNNRLEIENYLG